MAARDFGGYGGNGRPANGVQAERASAVVHVPIQVQAAVVSSTQSPPPAPIEPSPTIPVALPSSSEVAKSSQKVDALVKSSTREQSAVNSADSGGNFNAARVSSSSLFATPSQSLTASLETGKIETSPVAQSQAAKSSPNGLHAVLIPAAIGVAGVLFVFLVTLCVIRRRRKTAKSFRHYDLPTEKWIDYPPSSPAKSFIGEFRIEIPKVAITRSASLQSKLMAHDRSISTFAATSSGSLEASTNSPLEMSFAEGGSIASNTVFSQFESTVAPKTIGTARSAWTNAVASSLPTKGASRFDVLPRLAQSESADTETSLFSNRGWQALPIVVPKTVQRLRNTPPSVCYTADT